MVLLKINIEFFNNYGTHAVRSVVFGKITSEVTKKHTDSITKTKGYTISGKLAGEVGVPKGSLEVSVSYVNTIANTLSSDSTHTDIDG